MTDSPGTTVAVVLGVIAGILLLFVIVYAGTKWWKHKSNNYLPKTLDDPEQENFIDLSILEDDIPDTPNFFLNDEE
jgi:hypothetical protein